MTTAGEYRVEVLSLTRAATGQYQIALKELRAANEKDQQRINAEKLYVEGVNLLLQGTAESLKKSIEDFQEALKVFQTLNLHKQQADTLTSKGLALSDSSQYKESIEAFEQAVVFYKQIADRGGEATALQSSRC